MGCNYSIYRKKESFDQHVFEKITYAQYEALNMPIPVEYDQILQEIYGNYMLPPTNKFNGHTNSSYKL